MRRTQSRTAAAMTAVAAGCVAVYAIQPADRTVATLAARTPAVVLSALVLAGCADYFVIGRPIRRPGPFPCYPDDPGVECFIPRHSRRVACTCP